MTKGDEIRGLVREIENRVEAGILPDGNCIFDPLRVRLALELVLSVLEQGTPVKQRSARRKQRKAIDCHMRTCYNTIISIKVSCAEHQSIQVIKCQLTHLCWLALFLFLGFFPKWVEINHVIAGSTCKKGASYVQGNRN